MTTEKEKLSSGGCLYILIVIGVIGFGGYWAYDSFLGPGTLFEEDLGQYISPADLQKYGPTLENIVSEEDYESSEGMNFRVFGTLTIRDNKTATLRQPGKYESDFTVIVDFSKLSESERHQVTDEWEYEGVLVEGTLIYPGEMKSGIYFWERTIEASSIKHVCWNIQADQRPVRQ